MNIPPSKYRRLPSWREVVVVIITAIGVALALGILSAHGAPSAEPATLQTSIDGNLLSPVGMGRIMISAFIAACMTGIAGYILWQIQGKATRKRVAAYKETEERLARDLSVANAEKERLAAEQTELSARVTSSEKLLNGVRGQLGLLQQQAQPLFEAAKIKLIEALTHPSPEFKVPDELLKLTLGPEGYITPELAVLLKERETSDHPEVTPKEQLAAATLPLVVELAAMESKVIGPITQQLVSSPAAPEK